MAVGAALAAVVVALNFIASLHIVRLDVVFYLAGAALVYFAANFFGVGQGAALYAVASLLSFAVVPDKVWLLFFVGVFGPVAIIQTVLEKRLGNRLSAVITVAAFVGLFYLFGIVVAYGGGFIRLIGLPETGIPSIYLALGFAVFSAVIACIVNRGLCAMLTRRLRRSGADPVGAVGAGGAAGQTDQAGVGDAASAAAANGAAGQTDHAAAGSAAASGVAGQTGHASAGVGAAANGGAGQMDHVGVGPADADAAAASGAAGRPDHASAGVAAANEGAGQTDHVGVGPADADATTASGAAGQTDHSAAGSAVENNKAGANPPLIIVLPKLSNEDDDI